MKKLNAPVSRHSYHIRFDAIGMNDGVEGLEKWFLLQSMFLGLSASDLITVIENQIRNAGCEIRGARKLDCPSG